MVTKHLLASLTISIKDLVTINAAFTFFATSNVTLGACCSEQITALLGHGSNDNVLPISLFTFRLRAFRAPSAKHIRASRAFSICSNNLQALALGTSHRATLGAGSIKYRATTTDGKIQVKEFIVLAVCCIALRARNAVGFKATRTKLLVSSFASAICNIPVILLQQAALCANADLAPRRTAFRATFTKLFCAVAFAHTVIESETICTRIAARSIGTSLTEERSRTVITSIVVLKLTNRTVQHTPTFGCMVTFSASVTVFTSKSFLALCALLLEIEVWFFAT